MPLCLLAVLLAVAAPAAAEPLWRRVLAPLLPAADESCELGEHVVGGQAEPGAQAVVVALRKKAWEAALGGEEAARPFVRARLAALPTRLLVDRATLPADDTALLRRLARDTWRGLEAFVDREHQLPVDHVRLGVASADPAATAGRRLHQRHHRRAAPDRHRRRPRARLRHPRRGGGDASRAILDTLGRLEPHAGFFFNYYDTTSLERTSNLVSFVDSSWLTAGLMVARSAFPELAAALHAADRRRRTTASSTTRGTRPHVARLLRASRARRRAIHYGVLYAESRLGSLIAIGKGDVPEEHWFRMVRTLPARVRLADARRRADARRKTVHGHDASTAAGTSGAASATCRRGAAACSRR